MKNLQITVKLNTPFGVYDNWTPDLPSLLERLWFQRHGHTEADPNPEQLSHAPIPLELAVWNRESVSIDKPTLHTELPSDWYWSCSAPCYEVIANAVNPVRKRHDYNVTGHLKKRELKWDSSAGDKKNYDIPIATRTTGQITWFAVGDRDKVLDLLQDCHSIGKKRAIGLGQVKEWKVEEVGYDYSLFGANGELMRVIPMRLLPVKPMDFGIRNWTWRPCPKEQLRYWQESCAMPIHNVYTKRDAVSVG